MREIDVAPDEVVLSLYVVTEDEKSPLPAKAENDNRTRDILKAIKNRHIEDKDVKIDCLEIEQILRRGEWEILKYRVTRGIDVTLQDFSLLEPVLSDALQRGANKVRGILFRTTKHREHQFEARRLGVMYAKEKAGHLAELNGLALGKAITIEEEVEGDIHTRGAGMGGFGGMAGPGEASTRTARLSLVSAAQPREEKRDAATAAGDAATTVAPGVITISATVVITFELNEPK